MTLKLRLIAMMTALVMGVLALQFLLTEREKRELTNEIARLSSEMSSSARDVSLHAFVASRSGHPVRDVLMAIESDVLGERRPGTKVRYLSTEGFSPPVGHEIRIETSDELMTFDAAHDSVEVSILMMEGPADVDSLRELVWQEALEHGHARRVIDAPEGRVVTEVRFEHGDSTLFSNEDVRTWVNDVHCPYPGSAACDSPCPHTEIGSTLSGALALRNPWVGDDRFAFRFPLPAADDDSLHFVELTYPIDQLTDRLAASRQRSALWMTSLLGVGIVGAALMAAQFTRPIRSLERSFRRVEEGDLDVSVPKGRDDEIGRLTGSFNHMVGRLRESREMESRLRESERLATLGRLAAGVAHEVRNPLNAITLTMQQLRDKTAPEAGHPSRADFERYYGTVTQELSRLEGVVGAFLDLTRSESLSVEPIELVETIETSVELFRADAADRGVSLTLETDGPVTISGDPARLTTVWNNLLSNALSATGSGGRVTVRVTVRVTRADADQVCVSVSDTGAGIPAKEIARIWEPFYSRRPDGTGLGLGIVRSVVERHGGTVAAASVPGDGTTMTVTLPAG